MCRGEPESLSLNREPCVTERRSRLAFQPDERFGQTLISADAHRVHVCDKIAVGEEQLGSENLRSHLQALIQIRLVAIRDAQVAIAKEVFQFVGHRKNHRILRQTSGNHDRRAEMIVDERPAQMPEAIGPFIENNSVLCVDPHEVTGENTW